MTNSTLGFYSEAMPSHDFVLTPAYLEDPEHVNELIGCEAVAVETVHRADTGPTVEWVLVFRFELTGSPARPAALEKGYLEGLLVNSPKAGRFTMKRFRHSERLFAYLEPLGIGAFDLPTIALKSAFQDRSTTGTR